MPISYEPIASPTRWDTLSELRTPFDLLSGLFHRDPDGGRPAPRPRQIMLFPGFNVGERTMEPIGRKLRALGHAVHPWGLGRNDGQVPRLLERVAPRAERLFREGGQRLVAVGWSLGGFIARETARDHPEWFRRVITLGSPVIGGPRFTAAVSWYRRRGWDLDAIEREVAGRFDRPLQVPVTAIYSRRDRVVAWQACIDHWSPDVRHVEVGSTHFALGLSPRIIARVAREID